MADANLNVKVETEVELHPGPRTAEWLESLGWIRPVAEPEAEVQTEAEDEDEDDPRPMELLTVEDIVPPARPLRTGAMSGVEVMRYRAAVLRKQIMNELSSPERVDEMLMMLDINPEALPEPGCDC